MIPSAWPLNGYIIVKRVTGAQILSARTAQKMKPPKLRYVFLFILCCDTKRPCAAGECQVPRPGAGRLRYRL